MAENISEEFVEALENLEKNNDVDGIVALFDNDCKVGNVALTENLSGADGAREFWTDYRKTFDQVSSEFRNKIVFGDVAALEWTTTGTSAGGHEINYEGVSILETNGRKITRFYAYFNPAKLGDQIMEKQNG